MTEKYAKNNVRWPVTSYQERLVMIRIHRGK